MPARPVLVDVTRLLTRLGHTAPTGIDRVDLAYARHFLRGEPRGEAVALTPFGARILPVPQTADLLATIEARWGETPGAGPDAAYERIRRRLGGEPPGPATPAVRRRLPDLEGRRRVASAALWRRAAAAPRGAIYLHTSHIRLDRPELFAWLDARPDIRPVFFVHDLIPIEFPEYGVPGEAERHRQRMSTVAKHAAAVVVNSRVVAEALASHLAASGSPVPPVAAAWLGVETPFCAPDRSGDEAPEVAARPYFVALSTIEGRKNHLLLLQLWRDLVGRLGTGMPALVIVGRRGWESEAAADLLDRCEAIRPHVIEASGLSAASLARLVGGARALLMPSFAEGYSIPVVEALALGTPVIASDIPVHREVAQGRARLIDPLDGVGWREAVLAAIANRPDPSTAAGYQPPSWAAHFERVEALLGGL